MSDRDARLIAILRIGRDASLRGADVSVRDALKRTGYVGYRPMFKAGDLLSLIAADPALVEDWLAYSEDKRTSGGWYVLRTGEIGQVSNPAVKCMRPSRIRAWLFSRIGARHLPAEGVAFFPRARRSA